MTAALKGLRVLDVTEQLAAPMCSMILADFGAEVIKVERRGRGDDVRGLPPVLNGVSLPFAMINRNKRSLTLDLKHPEGPSVLKVLAKTADVLIENYRPGALDRMGLGYEGLRAINSRLVYCSISGFGQTGPYRARGGYDGIAQAMTGLMSVTGEPDGEPVKAGFPVTDLGTGMYATIGILLALRAREHTGCGQYVDCSLYDTGVAWSIWHAAQFFGGGEIPRRQGSGHPLSAPYQAFATRDGHVMVGAVSQDLFQRLADALGLESLPADPRFSTQEARGRNRHELIAILAQRFVTLPTAEWFQKLDTAGIPCGPINDLERVLNDPHTLARGLVQDVQDPVAGPHKTIGSPIKLSETPAQLRNSAPRLGEQSVEVLSESGFTDEAIVGLKERGVV